MRGLKMTALIVLCGSSFLFPQVDEKLKSDIRATGCIHSPLPLDTGKAFETFGLAKTVRVSDGLCDMEDLSRWSHSGIGRMSRTAERSKAGKYSLRLTAPAYVDEIPPWGLGRGTSMASFAVGGQNWEKYNRIHLYVYPDCEGARTVYLNLYVENDGRIKVPDPYGREGYHEMNLINGQWNECFVEMTELPRDKVTKISLAIEVFGRERTMGEVLQFDVSGVSLQAVDAPEVVSGWQPARDRIVFSTSGYRPDSEKSAIVSVAGHDGTFQILDAATSRVVHEGKIQPVRTSLGSFETIDFSSYRVEGRYRIRAGDVTSAPFYLNADLWDDSAWRVLNFMFCERCGYPVPGKHGACHADVHGEYQGRIYPLNGGWHDAADMSQGFVQTGEIAFAMLEMANRARDKGRTDLALRLMEEALWGLDLVMKTRLSNGDRFQGWGTNLWTDGFIGSTDDADRHQVRAGNSAFENFLLSGIEAYASMSIPGDPMLRANLRKIAKEDFGFAKKRFDELGFREMSSNAGHARMTSRSQYMATLSWAASQLYKLTNEAYYAGQAAESIKYALRCQRAEPLNDAGRTAGFFYRDLDRRSIVHFNHQSRDQVYMQALTALCEAQPRHPDRAAWEKAIKLYGGYLKSLYRYVRPYGMIPSGVYQKDEVKDRENFYAVQPAIGQDADLSADFREQLENGVRLDEEHYLRRFPVWFSFKGNAAVQLATGKAAALCGKYLHDKDLMNIAEQQLFWIVGRNPFGQSLIWGEGSNYPQLYTALPGEMVGGIPVGMESRGNEDTPYWPQFNTATYKEVWGASAGKWLSLISEF
jgi:hypothetical protein